MTFLRRVMPRVGLAIALLMAAVMSSAQLVTLKSEPSIVPGGSTMLGTLALSSAPTQRLLVKITSNNPNLLFFREGSPIEFKPGERTKYFTIITRPVLQRTQVSVTAVLGDRTLTIPILMTPGGIIWDFVDLGNLGGDFVNSEARDINNYGVLVGTSYTDAGISKAVKWHSDFTAELLQNLSPDGKSEALHINDADVAVGWSTIIGGAARAVKWLTGSMNDLGTFAGRSNSAATGVNAASEVTGYAYNVNKKGDQISTVSFLSSSSGIIQDLGNLGTPGYTYARAISPAGQIIGESRPLGGTMPQAFLWSGKNLMYGFPLYDIQGVSASRAFAINIVNQVVGGAFVKGVTVPFRSNQDGLAAIMLDRLPGLTGLGEFTETDIAYDVNNVSFAVGTSSGRAFLWVPSALNRTASIGESIDLNSMVDPSIPVLLTKANGIGEFYAPTGDGSLGGIATSGTDIDGHKRAVLLKGHRFGTGSADLPQLLSIVPVRKVVNAGDIIEFSVVMTRPVPLGAARQLVRYSSFNNDIVNMGGSGNDLPPIQPVSGALLDPGVRQFRVFVRATTIINSITDVAFSFRDTLGTERTTTVRVNPTLVAGFEIEPGRVVGASVLDKDKSFGIVTLSSRAPIGGTTVTFVSDRPNFATVPASAFVPEGETQVMVPITTVKVDRERTVAISATADGVTRSASLTLIPTDLDQLTIAPIQIVGGGMVGGTITLTHPSPAGGTLVLFTSDTNLAIPDKSVTIPEGAMSANFAVQTKVTGVTVRATISASYLGATRQADLTITPGIQSIVISPNSVPGGTPTTATVTLSGNAPIAGLELTLSSSNTAAATVPDKATVPEGTNVTTFPITTYAVDQVTPITITVTVAGQTKTATMEVQPPKVISVVFNPNSVVAGNTTKGVVTLSGAAVASGAVINLRSLDTGIATVQDTVTVPGGKFSASFTVKTKQSSPKTSASIQASYRGSSAVGSIDTTRAKMDSITISPTSVPAGNNATGRATLSDPAPLGGAVIKLTSSDTDGATVPKSVTIPAGQQSVSFTIVTKQTSPSPTIKISGTYRETVASADLNLTFVQIIGVTFSPNKVIGGNDTICRISLSGVTPSAGIQVSLVTDVPGITLPSKITIAGGQTSTSFTVKTTAVNDDVTGSVQATYRDQSANGSLTILAPQLASLTLNPNTLTGGASSVGTIKLSGIAPAGGATVYVSTSSTNVAVPRTVVIPAGQSSATFSLTTRAVSADESATVVAAYKTGRLTATLRIKR